MRCPDCNKFVSLEMQDPEAPDAQVDDEGIVTGTVRIVRTCAECGTELKEATLEFEIDLSAALTEHRDAEGEDACPMKDDPTARVELQSCDANTYEDVERVDRHGKKITNPRYQKSLFGAEIEATIACSCGNGEFTGSETASVAASQMDEMV